jgi:hypothetical protein
MVLKNHTNIATEGSLFRFLPLTSTWPALDFSMRITSFNKVLLPAPE